MRRLIPERICGPHECLFDVAMDAGVAAVVALGSHRKPTFPNRVALSQIFLERVRKGGGGLSS